MPTYDYECQACGHAFEKFQSMTARVLRKCPECGERTLERLIGPGAGFLFKGDGFYITDYRSDSYKAGQKSESPKGDGEKKTSETKGTNGSKAAKSPKPDSSSKGD